MEYLFLWVWFKWFIWFCMNLFHPLLICTVLFFVWTLYPAFCHHIPLGGCCFSTPTPWFCTFSSSNFCLLFYGGGLCVASPPFALKILFSVLLDIQLLKKSIVHGKVESFNMLCIPLCDLFLYLSSWSLKLILRSAPKSRDCKKSAHLYIQYKART